jgi:hypothetical protein
LLSENGPANSWYRKYSDGWIEQGISGSFKAKGTNYVMLSFPLAFSNTQYFACDAKVASSLKTYNMSSGDESLPDEIQYTSFSKTTTGINIGTYFPSYDYFAYEIYACGK